MTVIYGISTLWAGRQKEFDKKFFESKIILTTRTSRKGVHELGGRVKLSPLSIF